MPKMLLRLEDLQVDSFDTSPEGRRRAGTVYGQSIWSFGQEDPCVSDFRCGGDTTSPCWAGSWEGPGCDSTQYQDLCTCTGGGQDNTTCDVNISCGGPDTCGCAHTDPRYHETCNGCA